MRTPLLAWCCEHGPNCQWIGYESSGLHYGEIPNEDTPWRREHEKVCGGKLMQLATRPASTALDRLKEEIASGPHHLMCTSRMRGHNCNCWRFRALRIIEELKQ